MKRRDVIGAIAGVLSLLALVALAIPLHAAPRKKISLEDRLKSVMTEMVLVLKDQQYQEFVERFMDPRFYRLIKKNDDIDTAIYNLQENTGEHLRQHLEQALTLTPVVSKNRLYAEFRDPSFEKPLLFRKYQNRWYLNN